MPRARSGPLFAGPSCLVDDEARVRGLGGTWSRWTSELEKRRRRPLKADLSVVKHHDGVKQIPEVVDLVRRHEDRSLARQTDEEFAESAALRRIKPDRRLVEQADGGRTDDQLSEADTPLL